MPELTSLPTAELTELKERLTRLAREKAQLQLIALLMNRLSELPGLEKTVEGMLRFVMDILGGLNVTIFYRLGDVIHRVDVHGRKEVYGELDDDLVRQVFETHQFVSRERDFSKTGMATPEFTKATTWVMPLLVGTELVGVLRMDDLIVANRELRDEVQTFLRYASLVLKNEISDETRLRRAFEEVSRANRNLTKEVFERKRAEEALQRAKDLLERRVAERTAELTVANERLRVELAERARAEAALAKQHSTLRGIIEGTTSPVFSLDREFRYVAFNRSHVSAMKALYGAEIEIGRSIFDYMTVPGDRETARRNLDRVLAGEHLVESGYSGEEPRTKRYFEISHHPVLALDGSVIGAGVFAHDVTERQRAEEDRQAHLRFFECLDQINRALHGTNDLEQMLSDVLDAALSAFGCDRAWLVYPGDPEAASYVVPMERTRPEYPGALSGGLEIPVDPETAELLRALRASSDPVTFDAGSKPPLPAPVAERFAVQSQIAVVVHTKVSRPYVFGLHQCSHRRVWTTEDARLLKEIGRRLGDALTSLLTYRNLKESEERYRTLIQKIQAAVVVHGADTRVLTSNLMAQELLGLSEDELSGKTAADQAWRFARADGTAMPLAEYPVNQVLATRKAVRDLVARIQHPGAEAARDSWVLVNADPVFGRDDEVLRVIVTFIDVTELKRLEAEQVRMNRALRMLSDTNQALIRITDEGALLDEVCRIAVEIGGYRLAWVGFVEHDDARTLRPVAHAGTDPGYLEGSNVSWADGAPGRGPGGTAIRTGEPCIVRSIPTDPTFAPWREAAARKGFGSVIALPLVSEGQALGALGIYAGEEGAFDSREVEILTELAGDLAFGVTALRTRTKRDQAEAKLAAQHSTLRGIMEGTTSPIFALDREYRFIAFNQSHVEAMRALHGTEIATGHSMLDDMTVPADRERAKELFDRALAGEHVVELIRPAAGPGAQRSLEISHHPILSGDGSVIGVAVFANDITERQRAEDALRESEERYRLIAENTADTITVLDFELRFSYVSPSVLKLRGYSVEETLAQSLDQVFTPASLEQVASLFSEQMGLEASGTADPSRAASLELEEYCKDGSTIWVEVAVSFLRDSTLKPTGILAVTRDITRRKKADLRLAESEQKYRSLADSSPDNIVRYDADARLVYVNRNMDATVGFDLGSRLGLTPSEGTPGPDSEAYEMRLRRVIQSGEPDDLEVTVPNPAGEMRNHSIRFIAERSDDGRIIGALAFGRDVTERKEAARERQKYLVQLRQNLEDAVTAIAATVEARDPYTAGHQKRVAALAAAMARELGLAEEAVQGIHLAGTIHDLGKIKVPAEILARPGQLSEIEARLIRIHPEAGWEILKGVEFPWPIAEMVLEHHERLDGSGYPKGLRGDQISLGARILAVADVVEAISSHRPYRPSRGLDAALSQIESERGTAYDPAVVDACLSLFREKGYRLQD